MTLLKAIENFTDEDWKKFSPDEVNQIYAFVKQEKKKEFREHLRKNFYEFAKKICKYQDLDIIPHQSRSEFLIEHKNKLWLAPRDSFKSSLGNIAFACYMVTYFPDERGLITTSTHTKAIKFLREVKGILESPLYVELYEDVESDSGWTTEQITVKTKKRITKEPSIMAGGIDYSTTGMHFDWIVADDLVDEQTTTNIDQMNKTKRYFEEIIGNQLEPTGFANIIGTRWDYLDLYNHIISTLNHDFEIKVDKAIQDDGSLYFPSRLSREVLDRKKGLMSSYMFSSQYQQEPIANEDKRFLQENLRYIDIDRPLPEEYQHFLLIDPALTDDLRQEGCFTALIYLQVDNLNNWYVPELYQLKANTDEVVNKIMDIVIRKKLYSVHIENRQMGALNYALNQKLREKNIQCKIEPLMDRGRAKTSRIEGLESIQRQCKLYLPYSDDLTTSAKALEYQMLHFPKVHPIDLLDALSYGLDVVRAEWKPDIIKIDPANISGTYAELERQIDEMNRKYF
jgi:hypothetical protein